MQSLKKYFFSGNSLPKGVVDLSSSVKYNTGIELIFTVPESKNPILYYECYVDGIYKMNIFLSGEFVTGLSKNTSYSIHLIAVDSVGLKSNYWNTLNVSTANIDYTIYSDTEEADLYLSASGLSNQNAINSSKLLIYHLINKGIWNSIYALYPFKGNSTNQQKWNAKNPIDSNSGFRINFNGSGTYSDNGFQTNGYNAYADTNMSLTSGYDKNNFAMSLVCGTNLSPNGGDVIEMGCSLTGDNVTRIAVRNRPNLPQTYGAVTGTVAVTTNFTDARGIYTANKKAANRTLCTKNGNIIARETNTNVASQFHNLSLTIGCDHPGSFYGFSNQRIQMAIIHQGLTDGQLVQLYEIIDSSEELAGRKTW